MSALRVIYQPQADRDIQDAVLYFADLQSRGIAADPERFVRGLLIFVEAEADRQSFLPIKRPVVTAAERLRLIAQGQTGTGVMRLLYVTQGGSPWHIYFTLDDRSGSGEVDTLSVLHIRHAARR